MKKYLPWKELDVDSPALACPAPLIARAAPGAFEWPAALASPSPTALQSGSSPALSLVGSAFSVVPQTALTTSASAVTQPQFLSQALYPAGLMCLPALVRLNASNALRTSMTTPIKPIPNDVKVNTTFTVKDPVNWTVDDVYNWLILRFARDHAIELEDMSIHNFRCSGKDLINMAEQTFLEKDPQYGALIYQDFRALVTGDPFYDEFLNKKLKEEEPQSMSTPSTSFDLPKPQPTLPTSIPSFTMNESQRRTAETFIQNIQNFNFLSPKLQQPSFSQSPGQSLASSLAVGMTSDMSPLMIPMLPTGMSPSSPLIGAQVQPKIQLTETSQDLTRYNSDSVGTEYEDDQMSSSDNKIKRLQEKSIRKRSQHSKGHKLWEFIRDALKDPDTCPSVVKWEDRVEGVFRIVESEKLARLWGARKNNTKMTYEKLSRAMRTYYEKQILVPVPKTGVYPKKLVYKFGPGALGWDKVKEELH